MKRLKEQILSYIQAYLYDLVFYDDDDSPRNILCNMENILKKNEVQAYQNTIDIYSLLMKLNLITYIHREFTSLSEVEDGINDLMESYTSSGDLPSGLWWSYHNTTKFCDTLIREMELDEDSVDSNIIDKRFEECINKLIDEYPNELTIFNSIFE